MGCTPHRRVQQREGLPRVLRGTKACAAAKRSVVGTAAAPNNHFGVSPNRCVFRNGRRSTDIRCARPGVVCRLIAPPCAEDASRVEADLATPHDHFLAGPDGSVVVTRSWTARSGDRASLISCRIIAPTG